MTSRTTPSVTVERVYDHPGAQPGTVRILVDRLWPRGVRKDAFHYDDWVKDVAPSTELRKWYNHDDARYDEFRSRYRAELDSGSGHDAVTHITDLARGRPLVLLTSTHDTEHSNAAVLAEVLGELR